MTKEEAKKELSKLIFELGFEDNVDDKVYALNMAIQSLSQEPTYYPPCQNCNKKMDEVRRIYDKIKEQEPCDNAISCSDMLDAIGHGTTYTSEELQKIITNLLPVTQKSEKWISVSERLPEDKTYVLTTIKVPNRIAHARSGWYEGGFFHNDNGDTWKATDMEVKAWMPLPEPYEAESEE